MISKSEREKDRAICGAATPGPWSTSAVPHEERAGTSDVCDLEVCDLVNGLWVIASADLARPEDDGAFIATARTRWPAALDAFERAVLVVREMAGGAS